MQTHTGILESVVQRDSKNGKSYNLVRISGQKTGLFDWKDNVSDKWIGSEVEVTLDTETTPQYPRILKAVEIVPARDKPIDKFPANKTRKEVTAYSKEYLAAKLATELIAGEQIAIDEKLDRWDKAYKHFLKQFEENGENATEL